jgi:hypothetical protein
MRQDKILEILYPYIPAKMLAEYLGLTVSQVYNRTYKRGVKKDPKTKRAINRSLMLNAGKNTRYGKGHVPFNKGTKCPNLLLTNAAATMFKKGNKPFNTREANATSIRTDSSGRKYHYTKISDSVWVLTHRLTWEQANGPIPAKHIVRFIDGNTMNLELSNLECIPMNQNMTKNTIQRFPMELQQVMKLKSKLNKTINNGKKRNERS